MLEQIQIDFNSLCSSISHCTSANLFLQFGIYQEMKEIHQRVGDNDELLKTELLMTLYRHLLGFDVGMQLANIELELFVSGKQDANEKLFEQITNTINSAIPAITYEHFLSEFVKDFSSIDNDEIQKECTEDNFYKILFALLEISEDDETNKKMAIAFYLMDAIFKIDNNQSKVTVLENIANLYTNLGDMSEFTIFDRCHCLDVAYFHYELAIPIAEILDNEIKMCELIIAQLEILQQLFKLTGDEQCNQKIAELFLNSNIANRVEQLAQQHQQDNRIIKLQKIIDSFQSNSPKSDRKRTAKHSSSVSSNGSDENIWIQNKRKRTSVPSQTAAEDKFDITESGSAFIADTDANLAEFKEAAYKGAVAKSKKRNFTNITKNICDWHRFYYVIGYLTGSYDINVIYPTVKEIVETKHYSTFQEVTNNIDSIINEVKDRLANRHNYITKEITTNAPGSAFPSNNDQWDVEKGMRSGRYGHDNNCQSIYSKKNNICNWYTFGYYIGYQTSFASWIKVKNSIATFFNNQPAATFLDMITNIDSILANYQHTKSSTTNHIEKNASCDAPPEQTIVTSLNNTALLTDENKVLLRKGLWTGQATRSRDITRYVPKEMINCWHSLGRYIGYHTNSKAWNTYFKIIEKFNHDNPNASFDDLISKIDQLCNIANNSSSFFCDTRVVEQIGAVANATFLTCHSSSILSKTS